MTINLRKISPAVMFNALMYITSSQNLVSGQLPWTLFKIQIPLSSDLLIQKI